MPKAKMSMKNFISKFRTELKAKIIKLHPDTETLKSINRDEMRVMVINEPELLKFAREQGVEIAKQRCEM